MVISSNHQKLEVAPSGVKMSVIFRISSFILGISILMAKSSVIMMFIGSEVAKIMQNEF